MEMLKTERDKADTSKIFLASNGAAIKLNASAIVELSADDTETETLDSNYSGVKGYENQKNAYKDFSSRWKDATGEDFTLGENQRLIMYRRGDILAYRLVESSVPENQTQRVTTISDEITFGSKKELQIDSQQKNKEKEYLEPSTNRQGEQQFSDLPVDETSKKQIPQIGFTAFAQEKDSSDPAQNVDKKSERYVLDLRQDNYKNNWFQILLGDSSNDKDHDDDGVPDLLDKDYTATN